MFCFWSAVNSFAVFIWKYFGLKNVSLFWCFCFSKQKCYRIVHVIYHKRVRVFHQGLQTPRTAESTTPKGECFYCLEVFWAPDETRRTSFLYGFSITHNNTMQYIKYIVCIISTDCFNEQKRIHSFAFFTTRSLHTFCGSCLFRVSSHSV